MKYRAKLTSSQDMLKSCSTDLHLPVILHTEAVSAYIRVHDKRMAKIAHMLAAFCLSKNPRA